MQKSKREKIVALIRKLQARTPELSNREIASKINKRFEIAMSLEGVARLRKIMDEGDGDEAATAVLPDVGEARVLARYFANHAVRDNFTLGALHEGRIPQSDTPDFSDIKVVGPHGEIPWSEVRRISDPEMRAFMLEIEERMAGFFDQLRIWECQNVLEDVLDKSESILFWRDGVTWDRPENLQ